MITRYSKTYGKLFEVNIKDAPMIAGFEEWWQVEPLNMGFKKDGVTRWYIFYGYDENLYITYKY